MEKFIIEKGAEKRLKKQKIVSVSHKIIDKKSSKLKNDRKKFWSKNINPTAKKKKRIKGKIFNVPKIEWFFFSFKNCSKSCKNLVKKFVKLKNSARKNCNRKLMTEKNLEIEKLREKKFS